MNDHQAFRVMCSLAATGQLDHPELRALQRHLETCAECSGRIAQLAQIGAQGLLPYGERYRSVRLPARMTSRFVDRAQAEGIRLPSGATGKAAFGWRLAPAILALAVILAGSIGFGHPDRSARTVSKTRESGEPNHESPRMTQAKPDSEVWPDSTNRRTGSGRRGPDLKRASNNWLKPRDVGRSSPVSPSTYGSGDRPPWLGKREQRPYLAFVEYDPFSATSETGGRLLLASATYSPAGGADPAASSTRLLRGIGDASPFQSFSTAFSDRTQPHIDWRRLELQIRLPGIPSSQPQLSNREGDRQ